MSLTEPLKNALNALDKESELHGSWEFVGALAAMIPFAGAAVSSLLTGKAHRRLAERTREVLTQVKKRLEETGAEKVDIHFFDTEEFQTIFTLSMEQLRTTHDREKLKSVANALANSGLLEFSNDVRKEFYLSILRDLAPEHVHLLRKMRPKGEFPDLPIIRDPRGEELAVLQSLVAQGLITMSLESRGVNISVSNFRTERDIERAIRDFSQMAPTQCYMISKFGVAFLSYISDRASTESSSEV